MIIRIKKLRPDAKVPSYAHHDDAGCDFFAVEKTEVKAGERAMVPTGIAMEIPEGFVGLVWDKSGISAKHGIKTVAGVVDSGYRGEILIAVANISDTDYVFEKGHKVAQMVIQRKETGEFEEVDELSETKRGKDGFGSTGA
ncbi:MAG: dUTP diphosphatase [Patescibacteria group bacterium]|nr:dUTP diphosphatase [Patescibacteria group bacterium]MDE1945801.1 dUTP diphosphatase [Patescibacteria group bacterium]